MFLQLKIVSYTMDISLGRCLCVHSLSQIVEIIIQLLLYQRRIVSEPVGNLLSSSAEKYALFRDNYENIRNCLRNVFCTENRFSLREFVILIGPFTYLPKEIYRIHVKTCAGHSTTQHCGEYCVDLSQREKRNVFSSITSNFDRPNVLSKTDKVFFFVSSVEHIDASLAGIEEDSSFELPNKETINKRKIHEQFVNIFNVCDTETSIEQMDEENLRWNRLLPFFVNSFE